MTTEPEALVQLGEEPESKAAPSEPGDAELESTRQIAGVASAWRVAFFGGGLALLAVAFLRSKPENIPAGLVFLLLGLRTLKSRDRPLSLALQVALAVSIALVVFG